LISPFFVLRKQDLNHRRFFFPLRTWLESNFEVVTKDGNAVVLERLPLALDFADLQSLCYQMMDEFRG
jgi:hypothetical protein